MKMANETSGKLGVRHEAGQHFLRDIKEPVVFGGNKEQGLLAFAKKLVG
jgi:hypothetical protein